MVFGLSTSSEVLSPSESEIGVGNVTLVVIEPNGSNYISRVGYEGRKIVPCYCGLRPLYFVDVKRSQLASFAHSV